MENQIAKKMEDEMEAGPHHGHQVWASLAMNPKRFRIWGLGFRGLRFRGLAYNKV